MAEDKTARARRADETIAGLLRGGATPLSSFWTSQTLSIWLLQATKIFLLAVLLSVPSALAFAHKPSDSYLALSVQGESVVGQWDIALRDLDFAIGLDADGNGEITWGEVKAKHKEIAAYAMARLAIAGDGVACPTIVTEHLVDNHSDGAYAVLRFNAKCGHAPEELQLTYRLFSDIDPQHKGLVRLQAGEETRPAIFGP